MPPLAYPNGPYGAPDFTSYPYGGAGYDASLNYAGAAPYGLSAAPQQANADAQRWDQYVQQIQQALQASSGYQRWALQQQLADAQKGRDNAYKIAQLSAETSRYGVDVQRQTQLAQLKEQQRQFDANHGLEIAKAYTQYASGPDMLFAMNDFQDALGRVGQGLAPSPYGAQGQPKARTWEDFAALSGFGNLPSVQQGQTVDGRVLSASSSPASSGSGAMGTGLYDPNNPSAGAPDPRLKAVKAITDALPPSDEAGIDHNGYAALAAVENLYRAKRPGTLARMRPGQRQAFGAGLARLGYVPGDAFAELNNANPNQGRANAA